MNKINYPLPEDIDLTEDRIFRDSSNFISSFDGLLPWENPLDHLYNLNIVRSYAIRNTFDNEEELDFWIDSVGITDIRVVNSDNDLETRSTINGTNDFNTFTTITTTQILNNSINMTDNNITIKYNTSDIGVYTDSDNYSNETIPYKLPDTFLRYRELYKNLPFSPKFLYQYPSKLKILNKLLSEFKFNIFKYVDFKPTYLNIEDLSTDKKESYESIDIDKLKFNIDNLNEYLSISDKFIPWEENVLRFDRWVNLLDTTITNINNIEAFQ